MKTGSRRSTKNGRGGVRRKLKLIATTSNTRTLKDLLTKESFVRQSRRREEELEQFPPQKKHISSSHFQKKLLDSDSSQSNNGLLLSPSKSEINLDFRYIKRFGDAIFFCTPDYITPECQNLFNNLDCNKENLPCPESPQKIKTIKSKISKQGCTGGVKSCTKASAMKDNLFIVH